MDLQQVALLELRTAKRRSQTMAFCPIYDYGTELPDPQAKMVFPVRASHVFSV